MIFPKRFAEAAASFVLLSSVAASDALPVVDLGYEKYRAADFNHNAGYYNFSNIRYGAPPLGNLRFRPPEKAATDRSVVKDGSTARICPQALPAWLETSAQFLPGYLETGKLPKLSITATANASSAPGSTASTRDARENEDCLFLDVIVPQAIFETAYLKDPRAPVLVWIHGGGYVTGSKDSFGSPAGLMERSMANSSAGVVYVAINYRLGAFGFLSGQSLQEDGTANAGLLDQRLALQWVQDHISAFGGDKRRVTVLGESAGGGSILHHLTAYGGHSEAPFQQAIPQSPGWIPIPSAGQEQVFGGFLAAAGVSSLEEVRNLSSDQLMSANARQVATSAYGQFTYGPTVDGDYVTQDAKSLLIQGQFDKSVKLLVGHNENEGLIFVPPLTNDAAFDFWLRSTFPYTNATTIDFIKDTLYPPIYIGDNGVDPDYQNAFERAALLVGEGFFTCNAFAANVGSPSNSYAYLFAVEPALHGQDTLYTFYNPGDGSTNRSSGYYPPVDETMALMLQDFITSFAVHGVPESNLDGRSALVAYADSESRNVEMVKSGEPYHQISYRGAKERCRWWTQGLYY